MKLAARLAAPLRAAALLLNGCRAAAVIAFALAATAASAQQQAAGYYDTLPVPASTIYPGDIIGPAMLVQQDFPYGTSSLYPVVEASQMLVGKMARRTLLPGKPIPLNAVAEPELVKRGALTRAIFENGSLRMATIAMALQTGALGQLIQLRNVDSGQVITGIVQSDGSVRVQ